MNLGVISYSLAVSSSLVLALLLLTAWRNRYFGSPLFIIVVVVTTLWAISAAWLAGFGTSQAGFIYRLFEVVRYFAWYAMLLSLLAPFSHAKGWLRYLALAALLLPVPLLFAHIAPDWVLSHVPYALGSDIRNLGHIILAIVALVIVEQIFRNLHQEQLWRVKHLLLGVSAVFAFDFFLYADALLFNRIDGAIWDARGFINALVVPMLAVSVARNPDWSGDIYVSRKAVFHTTSLLIAGIYLVVTALVGYYIRDYGGSWGRALQITFLSCSVILLITLLLSGKARAWLKVFLGRNFFQYQYDYRDEWLKLINTLALDRTGLDLKIRAIKALADIVDSGGGMLWTRSEEGRYFHNTSWNLSRHVTETVTAATPLVRFLEQQRKVMEIMRYRHKPDDYPGLHLPEWVEDIESAWLITPLILNDELIGFIVLVRPQVPRRLNWEERDLLNTAGMQIASYVAFLETSEALMNARQFEAFNRLSSYVVHDLKNISAQLSLVVTNAERHRDNPMFIEDAINTVSNATAKMNRVLAQLRKGGSEGTRKVIASVFDVLQEVVSICSGGKPVPVVDRCSSDLLLLIERERLVNILSHLVRNAQEATDDQGDVLLRAEAVERDVLIEVIDSGCGMDDQFIREHLFRPFDTTKGNAGIGIGVYESRDFIWSQGGELTVESRTGADSATTFRIKLPRYEDVRSIAENSERKISEAVS